MKLVRPCTKFVAGYREALEEDKLHRPNVEQLFSNPNTIIKASYELEHGIDLKPGYVKATTLWLIDREKFIGELSIRHELTPALLQFGGNIGYEIRWSECGKGYGTKMLALGLNYCKDILNLSKVLITCDDDNIASIKVIENNDGILENKVHNQLERGPVMTRRYWIYL